MLKSLISYLSSNKKSDIKWYDLSIRDSEIWLKIKIFEYIVEGIHKDSDNLKKYKGLLDEFSKVNIIFSLNKFTLFNIHIILTLKTSIHIVPVVH